MVREGTISFFGKLNHRHPYLIHYEHNKVEHHKLNWKILNIAKQLNNRLKIYYKTKVITLIIATSINPLRALAKEIDEKIVAEENSYLKCWQPLVKLIKNQY